MSCGSRCKKIEKLSQKTNNKNIKNPSKNDAETRLSRTILGTYFCSVFSLTLVHFGLLFGMFLDTNPITNAIPKKFKQKLNKYKIWLHSGSQPDSWGGGRRGPFFGSFSVREWFQWGRGPRPHWNHPRTDFGRSPTLICYTEW